MFAILAERTLGPKLYGIFPEGRLEQFIVVLFARMHMHTQTHILCLFCMLLCKTFSMQVKTVVFRFCGKHFLCFDYKIPFSSPCDTNLLVEKA